MLRSTILRATLGLLPLLGAPALAQQTTQYFVPAKQMVHGWFTTISGDAPGTWTGYAVYNPDATWAQYNAMPAGTGLMLTELSVNVPPASSGSRLTLYVQVMNSGFTTLYEEEYRTLDIPATNAPFYSYVKVPLPSHLTVAPGQHMRAGLFSATTGIGVAAGVNFKGYYVTY